MHTLIGQNWCFFRVYIITQIILALWLLLTYDLLKGRSAIKVQKSLVKVTLNKYWKQEEERKSVSLLENNSKNNRTVSVGSWARLGKV